MVVILYLAVSLLPAAELEEQIQQMGLPAVLVAVAGHRGRLSAMAAQETLLQLVRHKEIMAEMEPHLVRLLIQAAGVAQAQLALMEVPLLPEAEKEEMEPHRLFLVGLLLTLEAAEGVLALLRPERAVLAAAVRVRRLEMQQAELQIPAVVEAVEMGQEEHQPVVPAAPASSS